jgi:hypothetical protein
VGTVVTPIDGTVTVGTNPKKTTMLGLDNATISFNKFRIPASSLLSRFGGINREWRVSLFVVCFSFF